MFTDFYFNLSNPVEYEQNNKKSCFMDFRMKITVTLKIVVLQSDSDSNDLAKQFYGVHTQ